MSDYVSGVGPLFGPDFVVVTVNDETGKKFDVQVYPDAHNPELRRAGLPTQYYFQPAQVFLARKHDTPDDYDFQMTLFKGLMSEETNITPAELAGASTEIGGGFCTFSTTFGIPDSVIEGVTEKLKKRDHAVPADRVAPFFNFQAADPEPVVGMVPITNSAVVCAVPDPETVGGLLKMTAQYSGKGSIEQKGLCTFLVSCNLFAGGAIASALKAGASPPFTVTNTLTEAFYINGVTIEVDVDVDKVYDSFKASISTGSIFGIDSISADEAYSSCVTSGGITTHITENGAVLDDNTKKWVMDHVDEMKKTAMDLVKQEIFDWDPAKLDTQDPAAGRSWFSQVFGGSAVSLKQTHEHKGVHFHQELILDETIAVSNAVSGDLNDLLPAVRAHLDKYLFVIDVGEFFKKVQVAGVCQVNFAEKLPDGTVLNDPLRSVQIEAGYPDFSNPVQSGKPNLEMLDEGQHYIQGQTIPKGPVQPAIWTVDNAKDIVNISFLRLDDPIAGWPSDQVKLRRKLIFDGQDPRVNLSRAITPNDPAVAEFEQLTTDHGPIVTGSEVGYVFVRFVVNGGNMPPNVLVTVTPTIGPDTYGPIVITGTNQKNALWEVYSDKYAQVEEFTYTVKVEVDGPGFFDPPVVFSGIAPTKVPVRQGLIKYIPLMSVDMPPVPADKLATVNDYVSKALSAAATPPAHV